MFESPAPRPNEQVLGSPILSDGELLARTDAVWTSLGATHANMLNLLAGPNVTHCMTNPTH